MMKSLVSLPLVACLLAACHHAPEAIPAVLADDTQAARATLAARLGEAIGRLLCAEFRRDHPYAGAGVAMLCN